MLAGLALIALAGRGGVLAGLWSRSRSGPAILIAARWSSGSATGPRPRTAPCEPDRAGRRRAGRRPLEPRFRPTDEVFVDPTSRPADARLAGPPTGERRYVAED